MTSSGTFLPIVVNIIVPLISGSIFFALAWYVRRITPMRSLAMGQLTYVSAFWGFIFFGFYLATRPLQILLGPHPLPLVINNIREFFMIGIFGPGIFLALVGLAYGGERKIKPWQRIAVFSLGIFLATSFCIINIFAIGGSEIIFHIGGYPAHDGIWFKNPDPLGQKLMSFLFLIRVTDPVIILFLAAVIALHRALTYPQEMREIYDNMPRKLIFSSIGTFCFSLSMLAAGFLWLFGKIPNQWWLYYLGALAAGVFETLSISLPLKKEVPLE